MLYPAELLGHIHKISTCMQNLDSNDLPLRRRTLYPGEVQGHVVCREEQVHYSTGMEK